MGPAVGESTVLAECRLYLGALPANEAMFIRINTGVFKPLYGEQNRAIRSAPNGTADLLGIYCGVPVAIETKRPKNSSQRQAQKDFQKAWESAGGVYFLARSVGDVEAEFRTITVRLSNQV